MKKLRKPAAITAVSFCLAFTAQTGFAQTESAGSSDSDARPSLQQDRQQESSTFGSSPQSRQTARTGSSTKIHEATELEGMEVRSSDDESIGNVDSLAVDLQGDHPSFIVVKSDAILGIGGDLRVVPVEAVEIVQSDGMMGSKETVRLKVDKATWEEIPTHERDEIAGLCDSSQSQQVYRHYNVQRQTTEFGARPSGGKATDKPESPSRTDAETPDKTPGEGPEFGGRDRGMQEESRPGLSGQSSSSQIEFGASPDRKSDRSTSAENESATDPDARAEDEAGESSSQIFGARNQDRTQTETTARTRSSGQCELVFTTDLNGRSIMGARQERIGSIDNVIVNLENGRVQYALISPESDGIGGSGEVYALAPKALTSVTDDEIVVNITRQDLDRAEVLTQSDLSGSRQRSGGSQVFIFQRDAITFGSPDRDRNSPETGADNPDESTSIPHTPDLVPGDRGVDRTPRGQSGTEFQGRDRTLDRGSDSDNRERRTPTRPQNDSNEFGTQPQDRENRDSDRVLPSTRDRQNDPQDDARSRGMNPGGSSSDRSNSTSGSSTGSSL